MFTLLIWKFLRGTVKFFNRVEYHIKESRKEKYGENN